MILAELNKIKKEISMKKNGKNTFQKYDYFKLSDILDNIIKRLDENIFYYYHTEHKQDNIWTGYHVFSDVETGESFIISNDFPLDSKQDNKIQAYGSTMTYSERYGLQMIFQITDDKDDPDHDFNNKPKKAKVNLISPDQVKQIKQIKDDLGITIEHMQSINQKFRIKSITELTDDKFKEYIVEMNK